MVQELPDIWHYSRLSHCW